MGIYPHWGLWKRLFSIKRTNSEYVVGQVGISIRDKNLYFDLEQLDPVYSWRKGWFYMKDQHVAGQQFGLASFNPEAPVVRQTSWSHSLSAAESSAVAPFMNRIAVLKDNLTGGQLISVFMGRRIQPLQHRARPMWQYEGLDDPTRCSPPELDSDGLLIHIQHVTKCSSVSEMGFVRPYASDHALPPICVLDFLYLSMLVAEFLVDSAACVVEPCFCIAQSSAAGGCRYAGRARGFWC